MPDDRGKPNGRQLSKVFIEACVANANELGLQMVIDYWPQPFGRAWRCDRMAWQVYQKQTVFITVFFVVKRFYKFYCCFCEHGYEECSVLKRWRLCLKTYKALFRHIFFRVRIF